MNEKLRGIMSTMESDYRVLVTGFVPFGGHATNISQTVASAMEGRRPTLCPWTGEKRSVMVEVGSSRWMKPERNVPQTASGLEDTGMRFFMSVCVNRVRFLASNGLQATG